jgi:hypothetical protein
MLPTIVTLLATLTACDPEAASPPDDPLSGRAVAVCPSSPATSIQAAIDAAVDGDVLTICDGTFHERLTVTGKTLTLKSAHGRDFTTIDADHGGRTLVVSGGATVTVQGLTLANGTTTGDGADLQCTDSSVTVTSSRLTGGVANRGGGASLVNCAGKIARSTIDANDADLGGGVFASGDFDVTGSVFDSNHAVTGGGGMYAEYDDGDVTGTTFTANTCDDDGAGLYLYYGDGYVGNDVFVGNEAGDDAGGLRLKLSTAAVVDNRFEDNFAPNQGGGAKISHVNTEVTGNRFVHNKAWNDGGGLMLDESASDLDDNDFIDNQADDDGGGLYASAGWDPVHVEDTRFVDNEAFHHGGGVYVETPLVTSDNRFRRVTIHGSLADEGAGMYVESSHIVLQDCAVYANTADVDGGGIVVSASTGSITNSVLWGNAGPAGSALRIVTGDAFVVDDTVIGMNTGSAAVKLVSGSAPTWKYNDMFHNAGAFAGMANPGSADGNLAVSPGFVKASAGRFALTSTSPLIDAGDPAILDKDGTRSDLGVYGGPQGF